MIARFFILKDARTRTGLRTDQAAAALAVLTDGRRVSVINAPAGSGKTWVLAAAGRAWAAAGLGRVVGITPSQSARNTLAAGVPECCNAAQFLGHLPGRRGARGPVRLDPGNVVLVDETSMVCNPDLADVIGQAAASGAKVILAGDTQQLQAVESGGGLSLLADALGFVQLAEPVRFRERWEQAASLRLRAGDTAVLAAYEQHARVRGGDPEQVMDAAAADYLALLLDGTDVLLMAADHALRRELSRRIRDDLIRLGVVSAGPAVRIADGAAASVGDLIICTANDHTVEAGQPGRALANGDLLRINQVTAPGLIVRRALDADPATGHRRWTDRTFLYQDLAEAELGYAVTDHTAQSRSVTAGLAVITGTEDRQHAYVALSRGTETNMAYVFTLSSKLADPVPGPRPAQELARYDRIIAGHEGQPPATVTETRDALAVLARGAGVRWPAAARRPRPGSKLWPTPITWPSCTRCGPIRSPRPASSATGTCCWPACHPTITTAAVRPRSGPGNGHPATRCRPATSSPNDSASPGRPPLAPTPGSPERATWSQCPALAWSSRPQTAGSNQASSQPGRLPRTLTPGSGQTCLSWPSQNDQTAARQAIEGDGGDCRVPRPLLDQHLRQRCVRAQAVQRSRA